MSFAGYHTNKKGIVLDLETTEGQTTLRALVANADVLIEDRPLGYLDRIGIGYQALRVIRPSLVMTSITGFGFTGPYRDFKAPNIVAFAMGGLMNLCGHPERPPLMGPCDVAYHLGSVHAAFGPLSPSTTSAVPAVATTWKFLSRMSSLLTRFSESSRATV